ncbi:MAG: hypothetical protein ACJASY_004431, partial [Halioglobus sp.]
TLAFAAGLERSGKQFRQHALVIGQHTDISIWQFHGRSLETAPFRLPKILMDTTNTGPEKKYTENSAGHGYRSCSILLPLQSNDNSRDIH